MPSVQDGTESGRLLRKPAPRRLIFERAELYPKQHDAIYEPRRISAIEASTKSGKTQGSIDWLATETMAGWEGKNYWWVAPVAAQADIAFRRMRSLLWQTRDGRRMIRSYLQKKALAFPNGAWCWFKSADRPDTLYGEDVFACVIDEASRIKEEAWHAVRTTLTATRGRIRLIGNVKGRQNWFYKLCRRAESMNHPQMMYHRITWRDAVEAGVLDQEEIDAARDELPEAVFRELYEALASEDEGNPFGYDHIKSCIGPLSDKPPHVWGWDLAKKRNWTVGIALDRDGRCCRFERFRLPWEETINRILVATLKTYALVDSTGVGDPIVERLQRQTGGTVTDAGKTEQGSSNYEGYIFTPGSKQRLMEGLAVAIGRREVSYPDGPIVLELNAFEYEYTRTGVRYSAPEGFEDDCVMSLALAAQGRQRARMQFDTTLSWV